MRQAAAVARELLVPIAVLALVIALASGVR